MSTQLNQNTTDLQSILDAVNALPEATSVSGEISITENGVYDVAQYASANVNIAPLLPEGYTQLAYIESTGTMYTGNIQQHDDHLLPGRQYSTV